MTEVTAPLGVFARTSSGGPLAGRAKHSRARLAMQVNTVAVALLKRGRGGIALWRFAWKCLTTVRRRTTCGARGCRGGRSGGDGGGGGGEWHSVARQLRRYRIWRVSQLGSSHRRQLASTDACAPVAFK